MNPVRQVSLQVVLNCCCITLIQVFYCLCRCELLPPYALHPTYTLCFDLKLNAVDSFFSLPSLTLRQHDINISSSTSLPSIYISLSFSFLVFSLSLLTLILSVCLMSSPAAHTTPEHHCVIRILCFSLRGGVMATCLGRR